MSLKREDVKRETKEPATPSEWQEAVDLAYGAQCLDSARQYGLVSGGPKVNLDRCDEILRRGNQLGYTPGPGAVERFMKQLSTAPEVT